MSRKKKDKRRSRGRFRRSTRPTAMDHAYREAVREADRALAESEVEIRADNWQEVALDWFTADARDRGELSSYIVSHKSRLGIGWARDLLRLEVFLRAGDHEAIMPHYDRAMTQYPRCALVDTWVAEQIGRQGGDWWRARSMLLYVVEQLPGHARPRYELGFQHYLLGDFPGALAWFDQAVDRLMDAEADFGAQVHYNRGIVRYALDGDRKAAIADVQIALRLRPDYVQAKETLHSLRGKPRWRPW
jgi:tetratricopeptide (TPR) repeat protein